jgi:hypothetical protein
MFTTEGRSNIGGHAPRCHARGEMACMRIQVGYVGGISCSRQRAGATLEGYAPRCPARGRKAGMRVRNRSVVAGAGCLRMLEETCNSDIEHRAVQCIVCTHLPRDNVIHDVDVVARLLHAHRLANLVGVSHAHTTSTLQDQPQQPQHAEQAISTVRRACTANSSSSGVCSR